MTRVKLPGRLSVLLLLSAAFGCGPSSGSEDSAFADDHLSAEDVLSDATGEEVSSLQAGDVSRGAGSVRAAFGEPLPGLSEALKTRFEAGLEEFAGVESAADGLGPVFNDVGCGQCHTSGAIGGASDRTVTRFGRVAANGSFDPLANLGGSLIQAQGLASPGCTQPPEQVPAEANVRAKRLTTALFGLGLLEAIPESALRRLEDPFDRDRDGVSGRLNMVDDPTTGKLAVGRFGWKAQVSSIFVFSGDAYLNEMGITSTLFPHENLPNGRKAICDDDIAEPEIDDEDANGNGVSDGLELFTDYMRLLAAPPLGVMSSQVVAGARIFTEARCGSCHTPSFTTAAVADVPQLSQKRIFPFSDLLLHDMGRLGDGIVQGQARGNEIKTPPLWGLRVRGPFLHDGRATTIEAAIRAHDGEGARAREAFGRLRSQERAALLAFLNFI